MLVQDPDHSSLIVDNGNTAQVIGHQELGRGAEVHVLRNRYRWRHQVRGNAELIELRVRDGEPQRLVREQAAQQARVIDDGEDALPSRKRDLLQQSLYLL